MNLENFLEIRLQESRDLLKYAETKNAGMLALNATLLVGAIAYLSFSNLNPLMYYFIIFGLVFNGLSFLSLLFAIFANQKGKPEKRTKSVNKNIYYFNYIAHSTPQEIINLCSDKYGISSLNKALCTDLCNQLIIINQISYSKFKKFNVAFFLTFLSIVVPLIGFLICLLM